MFTLSEITTLQILVRSAERSCQCLARNSNSPTWVRKIEELESIESKLNTMLSPIYQKLDAQANSKFANT